MYRRVFLPLLIGGVLVSYVWLICAATRIDLPLPEKPVYLYSNQMRDDVKLIYHRALQRAQQSLFLSVYGITDPDILSILTQKANDKIPLHIEYDASASSHLMKILPPSAEVCPIKSKGLMHRKIVLVDHAQVFLGSANLTTSSLRHHDNLILGIYYPPLAAFLENPLSSSFSFSLNGQNAEIFLLPDPEKQGLKRLMGCLNQARSKISIAMFTLTHSEIAQALIAAHKRGVFVEIAVDYFTARGASKKILNILKNEGVTILNSQGRQLLHHKWAIIDHEILIMGSTNWTRAAFSKNHDFLFFLFPLDKEQNKFLNRLWKIIESESVPLE